MRNYLQKNCFILCISISITLVDKCSYSSMILFLTLDISPEPLRNSIFIGIYQIIYVFVEGSTIFILIFSFENIVLEPIMGIIGFMNPIVTPLFLNQEHAGCRPVCA